MSQAIQNLYQRLYLDKTQEPLPYVYPDYGVSGLYPTCHLAQAPLKYPKKTVPPEGAEGEIKNIYVQKYHSTNGRIKIANAQRQLPFLPEELYPKSGREQH